MSKGTDPREQERLAHEWAEAYQKNCSEFLPESRAAEMVKKAKAAADFILDHIKPQTMADVVWDHEKHRGMVGVGEDGVEWVMIYCLPDEQIVGVTADFGKVRGIRPEWLTPNGERYELHRATVSHNENVADDQPKHPAFLRTEDEYEAAPVGTIVGDYLLPAPGKTEVLWQKLADGFWWLVGGEHYAHMPGEARPVIRWGGGYLKM